MGVRLRKSINLGGGFKINLSKSGIGYSYGCKGARVTHMANGRTRTTLSIPGTGISYVSESGGKKNAKGTNNQATTENLIYDQNENEYSTEIINISEHQSTEYQELLNEINRIKKINTISTILICTFILSAIPFFIFTALVGIIFKIYIHKSMSIPLEYEFDEESKQQYNILASAWMALNNNQKFWQVISAKDNVDKKRNAGANRNLTRKIIKATNRLPWFIKTNVQTFGLQLLGKQVIFLPDKLLIMNGSKVGAANYSDLNLSFGISNFVEDEPLASDAKVIGSTWLKVNKDGSPDRRFNNNRQLPICEYGKLVISTNQGLYIELMCSNVHTVENFKQNWNKINFIL